MDSRLLATIIIFPIWLVLIIIFRRHRQWLFYYLFGAFGLTLQLVFLAEYFGIDQILVNVASFHVKLISTYFFKLQMELLSNGRFQLIHPITGTSDILKLGIECSAVLESSILIALILFYPLFNWGQKILRVTFGLIVTYVINIIRLMIIVLMADKFGSDYIFLAHAGVARVFFFLFELLLYWYLLTKPTVKSVGESIAKGVPLGETARIGRALRLRHAIAQMVVIFIFVSATFSSFVASDEWKKAFVEFVRKERPIIYPEETGLEKAQEVLGEQTEINRLDQIDIRDLAPGEVWQYLRSFTSPEQINLRTKEGKGLVAVEVYVNDIFQNRAIVKAEGTIIDYQVFEKAISVGIDDILKIRIKNIGKLEANYMIDILKF